MEKLAQIRQISKKKNPIRQIFMIYKDSEFFFYYYVAKSD